MALVKGWNEFEREIIAYNRAFSIYGFGLVTKKIIHVLSDYVVSIYDRNYEKFKSERYYNKVQSNSLDNIKKV